MHHLQALIPDDVFLTYINLSFMSAAGDNSNEECIIFWNDTTENLAVVSKGVETLAKQ